MICFNQYGWRQICIYVWCLLLIWHTLLTQAWIYSQRINSGGIIQTYNFCLIFSGSIPWSIKFIMTGVDKKTKREAFQALFIVFKLQVDEVFWFFLLFVSTSITLWHHSIMKFNLQLGQQTPFLTINYVLIITDIIIYLFKSLSLTDRGLHSITCWIIL